MSNSVEQPCLTHVLERKRFFLILHDVSKKTNCGTLLRSASAFGCAGIIAHARRRSDITTFGAHGADKHLQYHFVEQGQDLFSYAKDELKCHVVGIEIRPDAISVSSPQFAHLVSYQTNVAFVLGNEGSGLSPAAAAKCDSFLYIPHHGGGTASLNVAVAGSIVFHRFTDCAGFAERDREGEKFMVDQLSVEQRKALNEDEGVEKRRMRAEKSALTVDDSLSGLVDEQQQQDNEEDA